VKVIFKKQMVRSILKWAGHEERLGGENCNESRCPESEGKEAKKTEIAK